MSSKPATAATMETPTTAFNSLFKHAGPTDHLQVLRGNPKEILLLTDEYMSPALHNSSDTYHRHLRSILQHGIELARGLHQRQWVNKTKERQAFMRLTSHLETHTEPFLHGFRYQHRKDASEIMLYGETKKEFAKREFLKKEERGMARLGWSPGDLYEIKRMVIEEESIMQRMEEDLARERINRSTSSVDTATTNVPRVSDNDTDSDEDDDEYDHIYSFDDGKPECRTSTNASICESAEEQAQSTEASEASTEPTEEYLAFASQEILRINSTLSAENFYSSKKPFLDERLKEFEQRSCDKSAAVLGGPNNKYHHGSTIDAHLEPMAFPSPLLASFCYKPCRQDCSDSDSDNDSDYESDNNSDIHDYWSTSCPRSLSPPTSLLYDAASIITNSHEESREPLPSPARQRKSKFLADLLAVRAQVEIDNEEDWEFKVWSKKERMQEKIRNAWEDSCSLKAYLQLGGSPNIHG